MKYKFESSERYECVPQDLLGSLNLGRSSKQMLLH
jgi:hypothetical protein